jgi:hypothetical protein
VSAHFILADAHAAPHCRENGVIAHRPPVTPRSRKNKASTTSEGVWRTNPAPSPRSCLPPCRLAPTSSPYGFRSGRFYRPAACAMPPGGRGRLSDSRRDRRQGTAVFPCRQTGTSAATISRRPGRLQIQPATVEQPDGLLAGFGVTDRGIGQGHGGNFLRSNSLVLWKV